MVVSIEPIIPDDTRPIKLPADITGINQSEYVFGMFCESALSEIGHILHYHFNGLSKSRITTLF